MTIIAAHIEMGYATSRIIVTGLRMQMAYATITPADPPGFTMRSTTIPHTLATAEL